MSTQDFMPIQNYDYIEFYVGNAKQAAYYFSHAWGFTPIAYAGLETGVRDRSSYVLEQGNIRFIVTSPLTASGEIADHVKLHGDGVKVVALRVEDARKAAEEEASQAAQHLIESIEASPVGKQHRKAGGADEHREDGEATPGDVPNPQVHARVVVTRRYKYVYRPGPPWGAPADAIDELYDLEADPEELRNLAADPTSPDVASALRDLRTRLATWMQRTDDPLPQPTTTHSHTA